MMNIRGLPLTRIGKAAPFTNAYYLSTVEEIVHLTMDQIP